MEGLIAEVPLLGPCMHFQLLLRQCEPFAVAHASADGAGGARTSGGPVGRALQSKDLVRCASSEGMDAARPPTTAEICCFTTEQMRALGLSI